jgi:hypothetical protein
MKKWTAKVRVGSRTFNAKATADSALGAKHKIASAAVSAMRRTPLQSFKEI